MNAMTRRMARKAMLAGLVATTAVLGASVSGCNKRFKNMFSKDEEIQMGRQFKQQYDRKPDGPLVTSGAKYERLQRIAARILPEARGDWDVPYTVSLVESREVNAFAVPGGPMYFYTGLLDLAESDDEIASVLGHEASHIVRRHSATQISDAQTKQSILAILSAASRNRDADKIATGVAVLQNIKDLGFSRGDESEADAWGFKYLVAAGYKPEAMATFFRKMGQKSGGGGPEWLSSHPVTTRRVQEAEKRAAAYRAGTYKAP